MSEQPERPEQPSSTGRRAGHHVSPAVAAALAVTAVLLVVGIVALVLGLRGTPSPPQRAAGRVPPVSATLATDGVGPSAPRGPDGPPKPTTTPTTTPTPKSTTTASTSAPAEGGSTGIGDFLEASAPTALEIPSIGVRSTHFVSLGVQRDGTISVPGTAQEVGLYDAGPTPGQLGPSVLAAHVDTPSGVPGIFHELGRVKAGDIVKVSRRDGSRLTFTVDRVAAFKKTQFPTELVYKGDFTQAEIRLVTCGGPTDSRNEYRDNVVVFGHLSSAG